MNAKAYFYYVVLGFALGSLSLIGCADSNYDLSDVDKTIAIGSEDGFDCQSTPQQKWSWVICWI